MDNEKDNNDELKNGEAGGEQESSNGSAPASEAVPAPSDAAPAAGDNTERPARTERPSGDRGAPRGPRGPRSDRGDRSDRGGDRGDRGGGPRGGGRRRFFKKKFCMFCTQDARDVDYKDPRFLRRFVTERGKILPRRITGVCSYHQRKLSVAIKRARLLALIPFKPE